MTPQDLVSLLPIVELAFGVGILVLIVSFVRQQSVTVLTTLLILALALYGAVNIPPRPHNVGALFVAGSYARFYLGLILCCSMVVTVLEWVRTNENELSAPEVYPLILLSTTGAMLLAVSTHFVSFFLGLETLTVSAYVLIAFQKTKKGLEAGIKYLVLASVSSALLLFGAALLYGEVGSLNLSELRSRDTEFGLGFSAGIGLIIVGLGFKLALFPFHMWAPDIYQGAPTPVGALIATISKCGVFAFVLRYAILASPIPHKSLWLVVSVIAFASMFIGNILALLQKDLKRILGYSSIAQAAYVLVAIQAGGPAGVQAAGYFLTAYFVSVLGSFGVITILAKDYGDDPSVSEYQGLAWRHPLPAAILTVMLFSLAGIPLSAGFIGKFYVLVAGVHSQLWPLVLALILSSVIGLFYYLRIIVTLYGSPLTGIVSSKRALRPEGVCLLGVLAVLTIGLGVWPSPLIQLLSGAVP